MGTKDIKIIFASTGYGPLWAPVVSSWLGAIAFASRTLEIEAKGAIVGAGVTDRTYTHSAENQLVKEFIMTEDATHLFLTESDMILPKETIPQLLALDKSVASGVYFLRNGNGQPCLYQKAWVTADNPYPHTPVSLFPTNTPFRVDCPGLGCVLIKRHVFLDMTYPWFDLKENGYGSDMYFFTKVRDLGIETWVDPRIACQQIDYYVATIQDYYRRLETDPKFARQGFIIGSDPHMYDGSSKIMTEKEKQVADKLRLIKLEPIQYTESEPEAPNIGGVVNELY